LIFIADGDGLRRRIFAHRQLEKAREVVERERLAALLVDDRQRPPAFAREDRQRRALTRRLPRYGRGEQNQAEDVNGNATIASVQRLIITRGEIMMSA